MPKRKVSNTPNLPMLAFCASKPNARIAICEQTRKRILAVHEKGSEYVHNVQWFDGIHCSWSVPHSIHKKPLLLHGHYLGAGPPLLANEHDTHCPHTRNPGGNCIRKCTHISKLGILLAWNPICTLLHRPFVGILCIPNTWIMRIYLYGFHLNNTRQSYCRTHTRIQLNCPYRFKQLSYVQNSALESTLVNMSDKSNSD